MKASIESFINASRERAIEEIRTQMAENEREHADFKRKLAEYEADERKKVEERRARATTFKKQWLNEAADKRRSKEAAAANAKAEAAKEAAASLGGPEDEEFTQQVAKLMEEERRKGHAVLPLQRLVRKVTNPPLISNMGR
jgi:hypothetical protein